jgi:hypothetical protein
MMMLMIWWSQVMDDLDEHCRVLARDRSCRSATSRRVALGQQASVLLEVDPQDPKGVSAESEALSFHT